MNDKKVVNKHMGEFPRGQRGQTVNLLRFVSMVRIRPPPPFKISNLVLWKHSSAGRASALQAEGHRFDPCCFHQISFIGSMAEQLTCNQQVVGSTPTWSSKYGGVPEWPKGADCKSVAIRFDGSNPSSPTKAWLIPCFFYLYKN